MEPKRNLTYMYIFEIYLLVSVKKTTRKFDPAIFRKFVFAKILRPKIKGIIDIIIERIIIFP